MSAAIFVGGLLKWGATLYYRRGATGDAAGEATVRANNDTMLVGASIFAAGAVISIAVLMVTELFRAIGIPYLFMAGGH